MNAMRRFSLAMGLSMGVGGLAGFAQQKVNDRAFVQTHPNLTQAQLNDRTKFDHLTEGALGAIGLLSLALIANGAWPEKRVILVKATP